MRRVFVFLKSQRIFLESIVLGGIAFALRVVNLEDWPRWYSDEGTNGYTGVNMFNGIWGSHVWGPNFFPPLFPAICGVMSNVLGLSYFSIRLPGAIAGAASIALLYLIVNKLYNRSIAIVASLLLVVASLYINRLALMDNFTVFFLLLTVFSYIRLRDGGNRRWGYLMGISAGLALLSKFTGIAAPLFIVFQSLMDKQFKQVWRGLLISFLVALVYPISGLIIDWNYFLTDTFFQAARPLQFDQTLWVMLMGHPTDQLYTGFYFFNLWNPLGFVSAFYLLARNKDGDKLLCVLLGSVFITYFIAGQIWWVFLLALYPVYCVAIAVVLHDIVKGEGNYQFLAVSAIFLLLPLSSYQLLYPSLGERAIVIIFSWVVVGVIATLTIKYKYRYISRVLLVCPLIIMMVAGSISELTPLVGIYGSTSPTSGTSSDQQAVANWINANTEQGDMVAVPGSIVYLLDKAVGIDYAEVALYESREAYHIYPASMLQRYNIAAAVSNMKYFVTDTPSRSLGPLNNIRETVRLLWEPVFQFGDLHVYARPSEESSAVTNLWEVVSSLSGAAEGSGLVVVNDTLSLNLASTTQGERVDLSVVTSQQYTLPLEIVVNHVVPQLDTTNIHAYDFKIQGQADTFVIAHYMNAPNGFLEVGVAQGVSWTSIYYESKPAPLGTIEWKFVIDSETIVFFENGEKLCEFNNTLKETSFRFGVAHITEDATPKNWTINYIEVNGERIR